VQKVGITDTNVLIQGESGTGKELVAKALHHYSGRQSHPFIVVDCGTLHDQLLESELFGHERGAYTGAISTKHGLFEVADTGTIFLDEIAEMSLATQAKILRFLETQHFRRLGGTRDLSVNVRVIAATNKVLVEETKKGNFREDLYYRLNVITLTVPPLRDRKDDIPILVEHFIRTSAQYDVKEKYFSPTALKKMKNYSWPGNVRELKNAVERALILAEEPCIESEYLPWPLSSREIYLSRVLEKSEFQTLADLERQYTVWVLQQVGGKKEQAARILGIDPKTLYRKLKMWDSNR
jgi:DNA-binding NtrC family response regulator